MNYLIYCNINMLLYFSFLIFERRFLLPSTPLSLVDLEKYLTNKSSLLSRNAPPLGSVVFSSSNIIYATGLQGIILNEFVLFESSNIYGRVERFDNKYKCINVNRAQLHKVIPNERVIGIGYFLRDNDTFFARYTKIVRSGLLFFLRNSKTHLLNVDPLFPERQSIPVGDIDFISGNMIFVTNLHNVRLNELIIFEPSRIKGVVTRYDKKYTCVRLMRLEGDKIKLRERAIGTGHVLKNTDKLITRLRRVLALKTTLLSQSPSIHLLDNDPLFSMRECIPVGWVESIYNDEKAIIGYDKAIIINVRGLANVRIDEVILFEPSKAKGRVMSFENNLTLVCKLKSELANVSVGERAIGTGHLPRDTEKGLISMFIAIEAFIAFFSRKSKIHWSDIYPVFTRPSSLSTSRVGFISGNTAYVTDLHFIPSDTGVIFEESKTRGKVITVEQYYTLVQMEKPELVRVHERVSRAPVSWAKRNLF